MPNLFSKTWAIAGVGLLVIGTLIFLQTGKGRDSEPARPVASSSVGGALSLTDHNGRAVTEKSWPGKFKLVFFGFTHCPDICPTTLDKLTLALDKLKAAAGRIQTLLVTTDPARDTPEVMKAYVASFHASIIGLTGTEEQVKQAIDAYKVYASKIPGADAENYMMDHSAYVYLMSPDDQLLEILSSRDSAETVVARIRPHLEAAFGNAVSAAAPEIDVEKAMAERWIGNEDAPVKIVEYASMTCDHCADFHNHALPEVKKALIETGKARLVLRDMPWDKFALKASMMARCAPPEKYFGLVETIFTTQDRWSTSDDPLSGLIELGTVAGMDKSYIEACMDSTELETAILSRMKEARRSYDVKGTPAFFFYKGAERLEHYPEFEGLVAKRHGD